MVFGNETPLAHGLHAVYIALASAFQYVIHDNMKFCDVSQQFVHGVFLILLLVLSRQRLSAAHHARNVRWSHSDLPTASH